MSYHYCISDVGTKPGFVDNVIYHVDGDTVRIETYTEGDASVGCYVGDSSFDVVSRDMARDHLRNLLAAENDYNDVSVVRVA
jgi:hypothetical protein